MIADMSVLHCSYCTFYELSQQINHIFKQPKFPLGSICLDKWRALIMLMLYLFVAAPTITSSSASPVNLPYNMSVNLLCYVRQYPGKPHVQWTNSSGSAIAHSDDFTVSKDGANVLCSTISVNRVGRFFYSIPNTQERKQIEVIACVSILSTTQDANFGRDGTKLLVCEARAYPNYPSIT